MNWHLASETKWRELASLRGTATLSSRTILPHFERSQKSRLPCEIHHIFKQRSPILKKYHRGQITPSARQSSGCVLAVPSFTEGALFLSLAFELFSSGHKRHEPLGLVSQFPLISKDAHGVRSSLVDGYILQYTFTYQGLLPFPKGANSKYRSLRHDCG